VTYAAPIYAKTPENPPRCHVPLTRSGIYTLQDPIHISIHSIHSYSNTEIPKNQFALKVFIFIAAFLVPLFDCACAPPLAWSESAKRRQCDAHDSVSQEE
jgi:hypothetical protein